MLLSLRQPVRDALGRPLHRDRRVNLQRSLSVLGTAWLRRAFNFAIGVPPLPPNASAAMNPTGLPIRSRRWQLFSLRRSDVAEKTATPDTDSSWESDPLIQARTPHVPDASKCSTTKCATVQSKRRNELIAKAIVIVNVTATGERNPKEVTERALNALGVRRSAA
jgi:hypothetical protein